MRKSVARLAHPQARRIADAVGFGTVMSPRANWMITGRVRNGPYAAGFAACCAHSLRSMFSWIADADSRLGPVLEAVINGRYYWVPFSRLAKIQLEPPEDLRDMVWMPAHLQFENGGESVALIPTRYPGSEKSEDGMIVLARKTVWEEIGPDTHRGLGQRIIATDTDDIPLMEVRAISLTGTIEATTDPAPDHG